MSASLHIPLSISAKTREELSIMVARLQAKAGAKFSIVSIYYDPDKKEHVLWYMPYRNNGGGIM